MPNSPRHQRASDLRQRQTKAEAVLWSLLRASQICGLKFRRQHPVGPYFADFACPGKKVIVEIDGDYHEHTEKQDNDRTAHMQRLSWRVLRFSNQEVLDEPESVARSIAEQLGLEFTFKKRAGGGLTYSELEQTVVRSEKSKREEPPRPRAHAERVVADPPQVEGVDHGGLAQKHRESNCSWSLPNL